ncbi:MAG: hypothetical protein JST98_12800, partial [Bacteroidetes bacterium]|nr:hypothetical protein [Bacteroidota bacterium]
PFGEQAVEKVLADLSNATPAQINEVLMAAFEGHRGSQPYLDDIALLTCRFR